MEQDAGPRRALDVGAKTSGEGAPSLLVMVARVGIGAVLLLMLFSAELRLNFGLRFDTILTLGVI